MTAKQSDSAPQPKPIKIEDIFWALTWTCLSGAAAVLAAIVTSHDSASLIALIGILVEAGIILYTSNRDKAKLASWIMGALNCALVVLILFIQTAVGAILGIIFVAIVGAMIVTSTLAIEDKNNR